MGINLVAAASRTGGRCPPGLRPPTQDAARLMGLYDCRRTVRRPGATFSQGGKRSREAGSPAPRKLLNSPALFLHFIQEKLERLGANDLGELGLVVLQDADPVHDNVVENPSLGRGVHQVGYRDVLIGADYGGFHPGFIAFREFPGRTGCFPFSRS